MKSTFIARLEHIKITEPLRKGVSMGQGIYIANDSMRVKKLLSPSFVTSAGEIEADYLRKSDAYLYAPVVTTPDKGDGLQTLIEYLGMGHLVFTSLWLIKDNSINLDTGFLTTEGTFPRVVSNDWKARFSNSSGSFEAAIFNRAQLEEAADLLSLWLSSAEENNQDRDFLFKNAARLHRVVFFLQAARAQDRLPLRIAHYCTCFETLFTTDSIEVSHKVAERMARFLGTTPEERQRIYDQVKDAYGIRSSVVHGELLSKRFANVEPNSVECDRLLRSTIRRILLDPSLLEMFLSEKGKLNAFFKELIFQ